MNREEFAGPRRYDAITLILYLIQSVAIVFMTCHAAARVGNEVGDFLLFIYSQVVLILFVKQDLCFSRLWKELK